MQNYYSRASPVQQLLEEPRTEVALSQNAPSVPVSSAGSTYLDHAMNAGSGESVRIQTISRVAVPSPLVEFRYLSFDDLLVLSYKLKKSQYQTGITL